MAKRSKFPYRYGSEAFSSKTKAAKFFSDMRLEYPSGGTITNPAHRDAVADLLQGHCEREAKIGCGVVRFFVNPGPRPHQHTTCFWIERTDGTKTDFGFSACVEGIWRLNCISLRRAVNPQTEAFKRAKLAERGDGAFFVSEFSGERFPNSEAHVDHVTPFEQIVTQFATKESVNLELELLTVACDGKSEPTWKEPTLAKRFEEFHLPFPLRLVSAFENLSTLKRASTLSKEQDN